MHPPATNITSFCSMSRSVERAPCSKARNFCALRSVSAMGSTCLTWVVFFSEGGAAAPSLSWKSSKSSSVVHARAQTRAQAGVFSGLPFLDTGRDRDCGRLPVCGLCRGTQGLPFSRSSARCDKAPSDPARPPKSPMALSDASKTSTEGHFVERPSKD